MALDSPTFLFDTWRAFRLQCDRHGSGQCGGHRNQTPAWSTLADASRHRLTKSSLLITYLHFLRASASHNPQRDFFADQPARLHHSRARGARHHGILAARPRTDHRLHQRRNIHFCHLVSVVSPTPSSGLRIFHLQTGWLTGPGPPAGQCRASTPSPRHKPMLRSTRIGPCSLAPRARTRPPPDCRARPTQRPGGSGAGLRTGLNPCLTSVHEIWRGVALSGEIAHYVDSRRIEGMAFTG
jgi:hypothetical protein